MQGGHFTPTAGTRLSEAAAHEADSFFHIVPWEARRRILIAASAALGGKTAKATWRHGQFTSPYNLPGGLLGVPLLLLGGSWEPRGQGHVRLRSERDAHIPQLELGNRVSRHERRDEHGKREIKDAVRMTNALKNRSLAITGEFTV